MSELYKPSSAAGGLSLPSAALERSRALADPGGRAALLRAAFPATRSRGDDADICAHLFRLCSALQADHLDAHGIACLFDVEPGRLPRPVCDTLGLIVTALTLDAAEHALAGVGDKTIAVTLRRRGALWACSVTHSGSRIKRAIRSRSRSWRAVAEALAADLQATYRSEPGLTAVVFAVDHANSLQA